MQIIVHILDGTTIELPPSSDGSNETWGQICQRCCESSLLHPPRLLQLLTSLHPDERLTQYRFRYGDGNATLIYSTWSKDGFNSSAEIVEGMVEANVVFKLRGAPASKVHNIMPAIEFSSWLQAQPKKKKKVEVDLWLERIGAEKIQLPFPMTQIPFPVNDNWTNVLTIKEHEQFEGVVDIFNVEKLKKIAAPIDASTTAPADPTAAPIAAGAVPPMTVKKSKVSAAKEGGTDKQKKDKKQKTALKAVKESSGEEEAGGSKEVAPAKTPGKAAAKPAEEEEKEPTTKATKKSSGKEGDGEANKVDPKKTSRRAAAQSKKTTDGEEEGKEEQSAKKKKKKKKKTAASASKKKEAVDDEEKKSPTRKKAVAAKKTPSKVAAAATKSSEPKKSTGKQKKTCKEVELSSPAAKKASEKNKVNVNDVEDENGEIKDRPNWYTRFYFDVQPKIMKENPELEFLEVAKKISQVYHTLGKEEKQRYAHEEKAALGKLNEDLPNQGKNANNSKKRKRKKSDAAASKKNESAGAEEEDDGKKAKKQNNNGKGEKKKRRRVSHPTGENLAHIPAEPSKDFTGGWTTRNVPRKTGDRSDMYWFSPAKGYQFRSKPQVMRFQGILKDTDGDEVAAMGLFSNKEKSGGAARGSAGSAKKRKQASAKEEKEHNDGGDDSIGAKQGGADNESHAIAEIVYA